MLPKDPYILLSFVNARLRDLSLIHISAGPPGAGGRASAAAGGKTVAAATDS